MRLTGRQSVFLALLLSVSWIGTRSALPSAEAAVEPLATAAGFPHVALYGSLNGAGQPLVDIAGGPINATALAHMARFPVAILPPTPLVDSRPDLLTALRAANSSQKLYAYVLGHATFCTPTYAANVYYRKYWEAVEAYDNDVDNYCDPADTTNAGGTGNGFLWWQNGSKGTSNVNLAYRVSDGQGGWDYTLAEDLGTLIATTALDGGFDGVFFDVFCPSVLWQETGSLKYDYQRAGYGSNNADSANRTAFDAGWTAGHAAMAAKIRSLIPDPAYPIMGNCSQSPTQVRTTMNGWMQENFPNQNGGTWNTNMYGATTAYTGYFSDEQTFRSTQHNFLFTGLEYNAGNPDEWKNSTQQRRLRFGLASAALGQGFASFGDYAAHAYDAPFHEWWADEYAVNRVTGVATTDQTKTGWLGQPLGEYYQQVTPSGSTNLVSNPEFETNTTGWSLNAFSPASASLTRVTQDGDFAAQATVTQLGVAEYSVALVSSSSFAVTNGQPITISFMAKASTVLPIRPVLYKPGTEYGSRSLFLTPTWKQYQITIPATGTVSDALLRFDLGIATGVVTIDSIKVQATNGDNVYRRDFQYGTILLNTNASSTSVTLEKSYRKITGTIDSATNSGAVISSATLAGNDALFLLDYDATAPAAVEDLHTQ